MPKQVYLVITIERTLDGTLASYTVDDEVFEDSGKARMKALQYIGKVIGDHPPVSWDIDEKKNNFFQHDDVDGKTSTGESCKQSVRWVIHTLPIRPIE